MAIDRQELERLKNNFYRDHYRKVMLFIMVSIFLLLIMVGVVIYLITHRPMPEYYVRNLKGQEIRLQSLDTPNLLPDTLLRWASQAAVAAYTFDFASYEKEILRARPYFTPDGWKGYLASITASGVVKTVTQNQLFVNSVVAGTPVIVNQGLLNDVYTWRVQMPLLVTYVSSSATSPRTFLVSLVIVRVPTTENIQGIGISQFAMH